MKTSSTPRQTAASTEPREASSRRAAKPRQFSSSDLFGEAQEIAIEHNGASYRLRKTSLGKLILTK